MSPGGAIGEKISTQVRGGQISPSENLKKLSCPILLLIWYGMVMQKSLRERKMGVHGPQRELQHTLAAKVKKSINTGNPPLVRFFGPWDTALSGEPH